MVVLASGSSDCSAVSVAGLLYRIVKNKQNRKQHKKLKVYMQSMYIYSVITLAQTSGYFIYYLTIESNK